MPHLVGKALEYDIANTVIEDSEPERLAEAAREKEARRKRKRQNRVESNIQKEAQILEIDSSTFASPGLASSVISVKSFQKEPNYISKELEYLNPTKAISTDAWDDQDVLVPPIDLSVRTCMVDDKDESDPKLSLNRFIFSKATTSKHVHSSSALPIDANEVIKGDFKRNKRTTGHFLSYPFSASLSKEQLSKLYKCYVCNLAWTARKTIPMKLAHIKSCAKKHGWSEDTLVHVLKKELHTATLPGSSFTLPDSLPSHGTPSSLLEVIVDGSVPKKIPKQRIQRNSVMDPTQAHSAIVERVKGLFSTSIQSDKVIVELPSTQPFQPSKLISGTSALFAKAMLEENTIPTTEKSLSDMLGQSVDSASLRDDSNTVYRPQPFSCQSPPCFDASFPLSSEYETALTASKKAIDNISCRLEAIQLATTEQSKRHPVPVIPHSNSPAIFSPPNKTQQALIFTPQIPKLDSQRDTDTDDIDEYLRQIIKRNNVLYERILRYEPVHFDVFLNLEGIKEVDGRGFRNKLRAFLDQHAISFYTDSALESNRRRH